MTIKRYREEIEDYLGWNTNEAKYRIVWNIKRLNRLGVSDINLVGAYLAGADLSSANLIGADLSYSNLEGANLQFCILINASLHGSCLKGAKLNNDLDSLSNLSSKEFYIHASRLEWFDSDLKAATRFNNHLKRWLKKPWFIHRLEENIIRINPR